MRWLILFVALTPLTALAQNEMIVRLGEEADRSLVAAMRGDAEKRSERQWAAAFAPIRAVRPVVAAHPTTAKRAHPLEMAFTLQGDASVSVDSLLRVWERIPGVRYVQRNHRYRLDATHRTKSGGPQADLPLDSLAHLAVIRAPEAWQVTQGRSTVRVGIVDTGLFLDHPDLAGQLWVNAAEDLNGNGRLDAADRNGADDDGNGYIDDVIGYDFVDRAGSVESGDYFDRDPDPAEDNLNQGGRGHGTIVAGALAARLEDGTGGAGVAPGSRLVPLRAFGADGLGEDDDIAAAIVYAAQQGLDVLNMSFGDVYESPLMLEAIRYAVSQGTVIVASGGNRGGDNPHYPSDYAEVIGVAWLTADGAGIAARGAHGLGIDLGAPGTAIYTTTLPRPEASNPDAVEQLYGRRSGSSMAAPLVAGAAALLKSIDTSLTPEAIRSILISSAADIDASGWDHRTGSGRLDVAAAVQQALPARVALSAPLHNASFSGERVPITGSVLHPRFDSFTVEVRRGDEDPRGQWQRLAGPVTTQVLEDTLATWSLDGVPDTTYTLRLVAQLTDGRTVEDRRRIFVDRTPPALNVHLLEKALIDGRWGIAVDAATDDLTTVHLSVSTDRGRATVISDRRARRHGISWSDEDGFGGPATIVVRATNGSGASTTETRSVALPELRTRPSGFNLQALSRSHGYLLPRPVDFDGDGLQEIIYNQYQNDWVGDTLVVAEWDGNAFSTVQQVTANVIPRDVGDSDGDGLQEVLTQVAGATLVFEQGAPMSYLDGVAFIDTTGLSNPFDALSAFGARLTDLDDDGRGEILVHNTRQWRLLESDGSEYAEVARLDNPTGVVNSELTANEFSEPQVLVDDFDGDGRRDLLVGDTDGDWIMYEARGDNRLEPAWTYETDRYNASARMTAGDFDGDGLPEFVTHTQPWTQATGTNEREPALGAYYLWNSRGDDNYALEETILIPGQSPRHGAMAALDVNGDGTDELAVVHPPHLYLLQREASGRWHLRFHRSRVGQDLHSGARSAALTVGDFDGDGIDELLLGAGDGQLYRLRAIGKSLRGPAPPRWTRAVAYDAASVLLAWDPLGADSVQVYSRPAPTAPFERLRGTSQTSLVLQADSTALYALSGWHGGTRGALSEIRRIRPHAPAVLQSVEYPAPSTVELVFSEPLAPTLQVEQFRLAGGLPPKELLAGQGRKSLALRFEGMQTGIDTLRWRDVLDAEGMPVADTAVVLRWPDVAEATLIVEQWTVEDGRNVVLTFSAPLDAAYATDLENYRLRPSGQIAEVGWEDQHPRQVRVTTTGRTLGATGLETYLIVTRMRSTTGERLPPEGQSLSLTRPAVSLSDAYVFPNPHEARRHAPRVMIAGLPRQASVRIYTAQGTFVRRLEEPDGNGGIAWDLRDAEGQRVPSGIYLIRVESEGNSPILLKAALVR